MGRRHRPALFDLQGDSLETLWAEYVRLARLLSGGPYTRQPSTFAPRVLVRPGLWYIPAADHEEAFAEDDARGILNPSTLHQRIEMMKNQYDYIPSPPQRPPSHAISFYSPEGQLLAIHTFIGAPACLALIQLVEGGKVTGKWLSNLEFSLASGIVVKSPNLDEVMEAKNPPQLPAPYPRLADAIARRESSYPQADTDEPAPRKAKAERPKREPKPLPTGDVITASDIATSLGAEPRIVRAALRKLMDKPPQGWQWAPDAAQAIIDQVRAAL